MNTHYKKYSALNTKIADLNNILGVLQWDQEVMMPEMGSDFRAQQIATLSGIVHETATSAKMEEILYKLAGDTTLSQLEKSNSNLSLERFNREKKLSKEFVMKFTHTCSQAYEAWVKAKAAKDFSLFKVKLEEVVNLCREKAELYGYANHPYDALMDEYEPGLTTETVENVFLEAKEFLLYFMEKIKHKPEPDTRILKQEFDTQKQYELSKLIAGSLGYDFKKGRLDLSAHPFSSSFNPNDARITTRLSKSNIEESIWGTIHEVGHALYEQGLPVSEYGLPSGEAASLGIHESQSRLWENNVGKSLHFLQAYWSDFRKYFPLQFGSKQPEEFYNALNYVKPDFIRINSDEVTYHFHIILRYEIEKGLIEGSISVEDLPQIWNQKIKDYLGLDVPNDSLGVMQDIHWSHGSIGYFPTYSLGSFYAAQFYHFAEKANPGNGERILKKNHAPLLGWLRENIHQYGRQYTSEELCKKATGEYLNFSYFKEYVMAKWGI